MRAVDPSAGDWPEEVASEVRTVAAACLQADQEVYSPLVLSIVRVANYMSFI